jgi:hypothetical protein
MHILIPHLKAVVMDSAEKEIKSSHMHMVGRYHMVFVLVSSARLLLVIPGDLLSSLVPNTVLCAVLTSPMRVAMNHPS